MTDLSPIAKAMEGVTHGEWYLAGKLTIRHTSPVGGADGWIGKVNWRNGEANAAYIAACNPVAMREVLDELYALRETALQLEAMKREMAELRSTLAGDHECKPLSEDRLEEILEFEERFKMLGGAGDTASLDWSTQRALIDEAVLACRARTLIQGEKNA